MVNFAAISQGYNDRNDYNRNKRLEVMKLFEEFKRNNPYATMADFQSFRDQVSGGRNYLAGGVGNDEALRRIVATNEAKRQQEERARQNQEDIQKLDFIKRLEPFIQNELLNMSQISTVPGGQDEYDYAGAATNIKNMFGGTMPFDLDLTNILSEPNRAKAVQAKVLEMTPQAQTYINSLSDPNDANAKDFASMFNLPQNVATQLLDSAKDEYNTTKQEKVQAIGREAIKDLEQYAQTYGVTFEDAKARLDELYQGNDLYKEWVGVELNGMKATFDKIQSGVAETRTQEARTKADTLLADNQGEVLGIINRLGNSEAAKTAINKILTTRLTETEQTLLGDGYVDSVFDGLVTQLQEVQEGQYTAIQAEQRAANRTIPEKLREAASTRIEGVYNSKDGTFKNDGELLRAAKDMSNLFHIDDNALAVIGSVAREIAGKDLSFIEKKNILTKALTDAGQMTFDEYKAQQIELSDAAGGLREPQTFDTYYSSRLTEATEITDQADKLTDSVITSDKTTEEKIAALRKLKEKTNAEVLHWNKVTDQDYKTSIGTVSGDSKYIWLDPTTPWNQQKIDDLSGNVLKNNQRIDEQIQKLQKQLEKEKSNNNTTTTNTTTNNTTSNNTSTVEIPTNDNPIVKAVLGELKKGGLGYKDIKDVIEANSTLLPEKARNAESINSRRQSVLSLLQNPVAIRQTIDAIDAELSGIVESKGTRARINILKQTKENLEAHLQTLN